MIPSLSIIGLLSTLSLFGTESLAVPSSGNSSDNGTRSLVSREQANRWGVGYGWLVATTFTKLDASHFSYLYEKDVKVHVNKSPTP